MNIGTIEIVTSKTKLKLDDDYDGRTEITIKM